MTPAFTGGFSFGRNKKSTAIYSMSQDMEPKMMMPQESSLDKFVKDVFPEAEQDEFIEEQRKQEVKNKALEKIKLEKELQEELEK